MTVQVIDNIDLSRFGDIAASSIDVGIFADARYDDGTLVADVAAKNEFGTGRIPSRPFFRIAVEKLRDELPEQLAADLGDDISLSADDIEKIGLLSAREVSESANQLREPPNAPSTIERKDSDNPLVDLGRLIGSVTYKVND